MFCTTVFMIYLVRATSTVMMYFIVSVYACVSLYVQGFSCETNCQSLIMFSCKAINSVQLGYILQCCWQQNETRAFEEHRSQPRKIRQEFESGTVFHPHENPISCFQRHEPTRPGSLIYEWFSGKGLDACLQGPGRLRLQFFSRQNLCWNDDTEARFM